MALHRCRLPEDTTAALKLWKAFRSTGAHAAFESLFLHYLPAVRFHARHVLPRDQNVVELDDLISAGSIALIEAVNGFDPTGEASFASFSWKIIRRAMIDELSSYRWQPKSQERRRKLLAPVRHSIEQSTGRPASDEEIFSESVKQPGWSRKRYGANINAVRLIATTCASNDEDVAIVDEAAAPATFDPAVRAEQRELRARLFAGVKGIDRQIVRRFLLGGELMKDVAEAAGMDRSTVNRRVKTILMRLSFRADLAELSGVQAPRFGDPQFNTRSNRAA